MSKHITLNRIFFVLLAWSWIGMATMAYDGVLTASHITANLSFIFFVGGFCLIRHFIKK